MSLATNILLIALCVLFEGFFSGSEMAMVSANRLRITARAREGHAGSKMLLQLLEHPDRLLGTCLIGTNLFVVIASTLVTRLVVQQHAHPLLAAAILTPVVLLFAEMLPKTVYEYHADRLAPLIVYPIRAATWLFLPFVLLIETADRLLLWITRAPPDNQPRPVTREEIRLLFDTPEHGDIADEERDFIRKVFEFGDATVEDAMMPLVEVTALPETAAASEAVALMIETGFSRIPVYQGRVDAIMGIISHRDLLSAESLDVPISSCLHPVPFVPETKRLEDLFLELRRTRQHLAVVVDEYGGSTGIISIEDIMEEIIGDIHDEYDNEPPAIQRVGERQWNVGARVEREPLAEQLSLELPEGDYETLAGFLLSQFGRIPAVNERIIWTDWKFTVLKATDRAIVEVGITRSPPQRKVP